jgi:mRNA interferase MazF
MNLITGDIVLVPFPFAEQIGAKVRPAVVVCQTRDAYRDVVLCAISSVIPSSLTSHEFFVQPDAHNNLRAASVVKVDRIVTAKQHDILIKLGSLSHAETDVFKETFRNLVA